MKALIMRTPTDGLPFYCSFCGMGWSEVMACEEVDCKMESKEAALARSIPTLPRPPQIGDYSDIMDE